MPLSARLALVLSSLAILFSAVVSDRVFENIPHIEDEMAYVWQAKAITQGEIKLPSPPHTQIFLVPFVVDDHGWRFGKYPLGWPVILAIGQAVGLRGLVNPLLAGFAVWLTYLLGKRIFGETTGLLAAALTVISPFFLMISGSLLSHPLGLVLSEAFALVWLDGFGNKDARRRWLPTLTCALIMGALIQTRPFTAVAVAFPFVIYSLYLIVRGNRQTRIHLFVLGGAILFLSLLYFLWRYSLTGNALVDPYTLWWPYDKVGFGPGYGNMPGGHSLYLALTNARVSLDSGWKDFFGWWVLSWIFLPFGLWASRRNPHALLVGSVMVSLVLFYMAYWIGSSLFGPRYYYEGLYSLTLFSAAGILYLAGRLSKEQHGFSTRLARARPWLVAALLVGLVGYNLVFYLPDRLGGMVGLYDIRRSALQPFLTPQAQALAPALISVHPKVWTAYGALLDLENPWLTSPFIFAFVTNEQEEKDILGDFPGRAMYDYYPQNPGVFNPVKR